jgi:hypothetical protein
MASEIDPAAQARLIDEHFDEMLYDGMPDQLLMWVEEQRAEEHRKLMQAALGGVGYKRVTR